MPVKAINSMTQFCVTGRFWLVRHRDIGGLKIKLIAFECGKATLRLGPRFAMGDFELILID